MSRPRTKHPKHSLADLLKKAAEDVPLRSGQQTFGSGPYTYLKAARDGSTRIFRFRSFLQAQEAMEIGMSHDIPLYN